ncbi:MAG: zf-TFIIB domain-containing protein [bacterium]
MAIVPSTREEEYFARKEFERKAKIEEDKRQKMQEEEKTRLKDLHFMRCPKDGMPLVEIDYKGIKIDECSHCKGFWLDSKELEAILKLEKSGISSLFGIFRS